MKLLNLTLLYFSYWLSRWLRRPIHWGMPFSLSVEPVNYCNLRCPQCPTGLHQITRPKGYMDLRLYRQLILAQKHTLAYLTLYLQGEPYLHPQFTEFACAAKQLGIYSAVSTNGHFLSEDAAKRTVESGLDRLIVSVDGASQAVYEQYRVGGKLARVLEGIQRVLAWKKQTQASHPLVEIQFIVFGQNESEIEAIKALYATIGADRLVLKTAQIYEHENGSPFITQIDRFSRYEKREDGSYGIKNRMHNHCWRMWSGSAVTEDGRVLPCCFDKDAEHVMGNLNEQSFAEIWNGKRYRDFRQKISTSRQSISICRNCTEGTKAKDQIFNR